MSHITGLGIARIAAPAGLQFRSTASALQCTPQSKRLISSLLAASFCLRSNDPKHPLVLYPSCDPNDQKNESSTDLFSLSDPNDGDVLTVFVSIVPLFEPKGRFIS